jgi:competence protein CoiA
LQYALVDGERREAFPAGRGQCPLCGAPTLAKCGPRVIHHWSHAGRKNCDPWWESETEWHRQWKSLFPPVHREVSYTAPDGEIHRADVVTQSGIVIEFQHSQMTDAERLSREDFYKNLVWVLDGREFRRNFDIYHPLPHPASELAQDIVWLKATRPMQGAARGIFLRLSEGILEDPNTTKATLRGGYMHFMYEIQTKMHEAYAGHHQYDWVRPRRTWLDATCPVYVDLGFDALARLETYDESGLLCIRLIPKRIFVHDVMTENGAKDIAKHFCPLLPDESI